MGRISIEERCTRTVTNISDLFLKEFHFFLLISLDSLLLLSQPFNLSHEGGDAFLELPVLPGKRLFDLLERLPLLLVLVLPKLLLRGNPLDL